MDIKNFNIARYFFNVGYTGTNSGGVLYWSPAAGNRFGAELLGDDIFKQLRSKFNMTYASRYGGLDGIDGVYVNFNRRYIAHLCNLLAKIDPSVIVFNVADGRELVFFDALCSVINARGVALLHNVDDYLKLSITRELNLDSVAADRLYTDALNSTTCGRQQACFLTGRENEFIFGNYVRKVLPVSNRSGGVVSVGRFNKRFKRTDILLNTAVETGLPVKLYGSVEQFGGLEVPACIQHVPYASDLRECYHTARFLAITSIVESFPNVVLEAWSAGVPIVTIADCLAMRSLITDGVDGFVARTPADFSATLVNAYAATASTVNTVVANGRERAASYTPTTTLRSLVEVIDRELANTRHARA